MANASIKAAFERFWQHTIAKTSDMIEARVNTVANTAGSTNSTSKLYLIGATTQSTSSQTYSNTAVYATNGALVASTVKGAVWNDYAEYRKSNIVDSGRVVVETGKGDLILSSERLLPGGNIISDTFGFSIGETDECQTPIAVAGRVLAYPNEDINIFCPGDAVCTGPNGTVSKMTRDEICQYPDRIIGTVSEIPEYDFWGTNNVKVNGRIWIKLH